MVFNPSLRMVLLLSDFFRVSDRVWRKALIAKMARKGLPSCYIRWVRGFLSDRKASVSWQVSTSRKQTFFKALPQGSVFVPILWLICMDDLLNDSSSGAVASGFANDTTFGAQGSRVAYCKVALQPADCRLQTSCTDGVKHGKCCLA